MKKNILIVQSYNPNKGNSSVITATQYALKDEDVNIEITAAVPEMGRNQFNVTCHDWLVSYKKIVLQKSKLKKIIALLQEGLWVLYLFIWILLYKLGIKLYIPKRKRATINAYFKSDIVVFPGGHSFTSMNGFGRVFSHCMGLYFGKIIEKKTMVYAHTIGPFKGKLGPIIKWMSMYVLRRTDLITLREKDSLKYCEGCNVKLTAETVFSLPTDTSKANDVEELNELRKKGKTIVGLTIHHIYYKYFFSKETYMKKMVNIINTIIDKYNCSVLLIPMESITGNYNDVDMAKEMKAMLNSPDQFIVLEKDYTPIVSSAIIGSVDLFVGTKTHSIVYGLKSGVPTLSISYQQKANEFMNMFGVLNHAINLKDLEEDKFEEIFQHILANLESTRRLQEENYQIIRKKSLENKDLLLQLLS